MYNPIEIDFALLIIHALLPCINRQLKLPLINVETILSEYIFWNKEFYMSNCMFDNNTIIEIKFIFERIILQLVYDISAFWLSIFL